VGASCEGRAMQLARVAGHFSRAFGIRNNRRAAGTRNRAGSFDSTRLIARVVATWRSVVRRALRVVAMRRNHGSGALTRGRRC